MQTTWINVEDRLPEDRKPKLCYVRPLELDGSPYYKITYLNPGKTGFYVKYTEEGDRPIEQVTHWTELPPAPTN